MDSLHEWNDEILRAMAHPIKKRIIECLQDASLSFTELLDEIPESNHGKFGYHLRTLRAFAELEPSTGKYRLTNRGKLLATCVQDIRIITSMNKRCAKYIQALRFGDHAVAFYTTEDFKRKITFPYLNAGLQKREAVVYIVSKNRFDKAIREIQRYGIDLNHLQKGALNYVGLPMVSGRRESPR